MKKIFSILLTTALLCSMLLPMTVSAEEVISATGTTVIEVTSAYRDFYDTDGTKWQGTQDKADSNASGGYFIRVNRAAFTDHGLRTAENSIPVSVASAGEYIVTFVASKESVPSLKVYNGQDSVSYDSYAQTDLKFRYNDTGANFYAMEYYYTVNLTEDTTSIAVVLPSHKKNSTTWDFCLAMDCIRFTKKTESNVISNGSSEVTVVYDAAQRAAGQAILALYNGKQLVAVEKLDNSLGKLIMQFSTTYAGEFDKAIVYIWEDLVNCVPKVARKALTVN